MTNSFSADEGKALSVEGRVMLSVRERRSGEQLWSDDPEKIGAFTENRDHISAYLPAEIFNSFWKAAVATYDAPPSIEVVLKTGDAEHPRILSVKSIGLIEGTASHVHPVVAELRSMRDAISRQIKVLSIWLYIGLGVWVLVSLYRWLVP